MRAYEVWYKSNNKLMSKVYEASSAEAARLAFYMDPGLGRFISVLPAL